MNIDENSKIVIFGDDGFISNYLIRRLAKTNAKITLVDKHANLQKDFSLMSSVGQISFNKMPNNEIEWGDIFFHATHVINLTDIFFETKKSTFEFINVELARKIAYFAKLNDVDVLIHLSAITCKSSKSKYNISKLSGEKAVLSEFPEAVIFRPSLIFGPEDRFLNFFIRIVKHSFFVPMLVSGKTKFQPIYVDDVANAIEKCCYLAKSKISGKIFEIGGEQQYSMKQLVKIIASLMQKKRIFVSMPLSLSLILVYIFKVALYPLLTVEKVRFFKKNNVITASNAIDELNIAPRNLNYELKRYIG